MPYIEKPPWEITFAEYLKMTKKERQKLRQMVLADEGVRALIKKHIIKEGCCWILICGTNEYIMGLAFTKGQILLPQKISHFASNRKKAPFEFRASDQDVQEIISRLT